MLEYIKALKDIDISFSLSGIWEFINNMSFPVATVAIGLLVLLAIQGYKIFKSLTYVFAAVGLGFAGHLYLAPRLTPLIADKIPDSIPLDVDVAIAFLCAMFGIVLAHFSYEFIIFCLGGVCGYLVGYMFVAGKLAAYFNTISFLTSDFAYKAVGVVCGLIVAIMFLLMFKYLYIIGTSVGFMATAGYLLFKEMIPAGGKKIGLCFIGVGVIIGIIMMVHQFNEEKELDEFNF